MLRAICSGLVSTAETGQGSAGGPDGQGPAETGRASAIGPDGQGPAETGRQIHTAKVQLSRELQT